ncbi:AraC family transcriptional regulator [Vallitalea guaymasensis]|uniref:AraC family transcriptional regulator n=1 Tax=Vallitalea guaymasensis TaxID=1185412 RepID=UPI000DE43943|nr:AraC family transcriptional regulator [Vallitalea guaymasensis]
MRENIKINLSDYEDDFMLLNKICYKDILVNNIQLKILGIHYMDTDPDWNVSKHKHSFFEFHYITDNYVFTTSNGIKRKITPGQFYTLAPGVLHSHCQEDGIGHTGFSMRWEIVTNSAFNNEQLNLIKSKQLIESIYATGSEPLTDDDTILNGVLNLLELGRQGCSELELQLAFFQIVLKLSKYANQDLSELKSNIGSKDDSFDNNIVINTIQFIEDNYYQDINVNDVANSVHVSYSHLSRLFKNSVGETVNQYIKKVRLKKAAYLLKCTNKDMSTIAKEVGFNSEYYFCNDFKKNVGMSPGNYRKSNSSLSE